MAKIHIGLPVYNGEAYLASALDSLLRQTFPDFEVIISDNGSTDATPEIAREYAAKDSRIRVLRYEENRGAAWNWNNAFAHSSAEYFKWAAHDDLHHPQYLERCMEVLEREPAVVLCYSATRYIDADGRAIKADATKSIVGGKRSDGCHLRQPRPHQRLRHIFGRYPMHVLFGVVRREALTRTRGMGTYPSADRILVMEIALQGQMHEIDEELFIRRIHPAISWTRKTSEQEYAVWYDPKNRGRRAIPVLRRGVELAFGILHARLAKPDAIRSYIELLRYVAGHRRWVRLRRRLMLKIRRKVKSVLGISPELPKAAED